MIILLFACTDHKKEKQKVIAQVGNRTISQEDFILRAEMSPEMSYSGPVEKRAGYLLDLLVNEKLAALAAEKMGLDKSAQVQQMAGFIEDMALSRELYRREVLSKVSGANTELEQAMKRQLETRTVAYLGFRDRTTAQLYQDRLCAGMTFNHALRKLYGLAADTTSNRRVIKWGEDDPALEEAAYQLEIGQISSVLPVAGGFMVAKLQDIEYSVVSTEADEARRKERGQRILTARKDAEISARFVVKFMQNQRVRFNEPIAADLANTFVEQAMAYHDTNKAIKPDRPLEQQGWINARQTLRHRLDETFVSFAGGQFSLRESAAIWL